MANKLFSTGQAAGIANISTKTLERYIKCFGEFFSEGARINKRGRRYTGDDLKLILFIHRLYGRRTKLPDIVAALKGEVTQEEVQHFDFEEVGQILLDAVAGLSKAEKTNTQANNRIKSYDQDIGYVTRSIVKLRNVRRRCSDNLSLIIFKLILSRLIIQII